MVIPESQLSNLSLRFVANRRMIVPEPLAVVVRSRNLVLDKHCLQSHAPLNDLSRGGKDRFKQGKRIVVVFHARQDITVRTVEAGSDRLSGGSTARI